MNRLGSEVTVVAGAPVQTCVVWAGEEEHDVLITLNKAPSDHAYAVLRFGNDCCVISVELDLTDKPQQVVVRASRVSIDLGADYGSMREQKLTAMIAFDQKKKPAQLQGVRSRYLVGDGHFSIPPFARSVRVAGQVRLRMLDCRGRVTTMIDTDGSSEAIPLPDDACDIACAGSGRFVFDINTSALR